MLIIPNIVCTYKKTPQTDQLRLRCLKLLCCFLLVSDQLDDAHLRCGFEGMCGIAGGQYCHSLIQLFPDRMETGAHKRPSRSLPLKVCHIFQK